MPPSDHPKIRSPRLQVEDALTEMLETLGPGDQLPPEPSLAKELGVSRATLREVMQTFVERGFLVRKHGVGTFVAARLPVLETGMEVLESLATQAARLDLETETRHLKIVERLATARERKGLECTEKEVRVLAISRVIAVENRPVADLLDVVPLDCLGRDDLQTDFRGSVLDLLLERSYPLLCTSRTEIMATPAHDPCAARLAVQDGAPLLKLVAQLYNCEERVVDYSVSYFVPGHFKFHVMRKVQG